MKKTALEDIIERLRITQLELETEIERLLKQKQAQFHYSLRLGKVYFERNIYRWQRQQRTNVWRYLIKAPLRSILSAPIIYSMFIPLFILDISISFYQHTCFRIYGIPRVKRAEHIIIDRHRLAYLNAIESFNCVYCGYGNGVIEYAREIIARTEQYWCPIKHAQRSKDPHQRAHKFIDYGNAEAWRKEFRTIRMDWSDSEKDNK